MKATKTKRKYTRITPAEKARFKALEALHGGNGSQAVRELTPHILNVGNRAYQIRKKEEKENTVDYIDDRLQQIGVDAIDQLADLVLSTDERIRTKNVHYVIDHLRGQATKKSITLHGKANIQSVLD